MIFVFPSFRELYLPEDARNLAKPWHQVQCTFEQLSHGVSRGVKMPLAWLKSFYDLFNNLLGHGYYSFADVCVSSTNGGRYSIVPLCGDIIDHDCATFGHVAHFNRIVARIPLQRPSYTSPWQSKHSKCKCSHFSGKWFR